MKSRIMTPAPEKILIYGFDAEYEARFLRAAELLRIRLETIPEDSAAEKVGLLAGFKGFEPSGKALTRAGQCVIFSCIGEKKLNKVLEVMRSCGLGGIPLKAAVTESNLRMTLSELMDELEKEHKKMHGQS